MIDKKKINNCSSCFACYNICPKQCIQMKEDKNGFKYPVIDEEKCIKCGLCNKMCNTENSKIRKTKTQIYYGWSKDEENRKNSASGGMFGELAKIIFEKKRNSIWCRI